MAFHATTTAIAVLAIASSAMAAENYCLVPERNQAVVETFIRSHDVRGVCNSHVIIKCSESEQERLSNRYGKIQTLSPSRKLWCMEPISDDVTKADLLSIKQFPRYQIGNGLLFDIDEIASRSVISEVPTYHRFFQLTETALKPTSFNGQRYTASFNRNAVVDKALSAVSQISLKNFAEFLSGENPSSPLVTRNSYSKDILVAAKYLQSEYRSHGFLAIQQPFRNDMGPNVIAIRTGTKYPNKFIVIGAHFDSRSRNNSSPTDRAPGANDDGSGTAMLLEVARIIGEMNVQFELGIILGSWSGEEQGLLGSRAFAKYAKDNDMDIEAMLQGDMLAYRKEGEDFQIGFPDRFHTESLADTVKNITAQYVPQVRTCTTSACCSDHQSFYELGYASTQFFERCGSIADNTYHQPSDLVNRPGYDIEQLALITKAMFASLLVLAGAY